jgi:uncharacterized membrane protein
MDLSNPTNLAIAGAYYLITGVLMFFSLFGVYILMRYGKSVLLALFVSLLYCLFFLIIFSHSYQAFQSLLSPG